MLAGIVVLSVLLLAALVWAGITASKLGAARTTIDERDAAVARFEGEVAAATAAKEEEASKAAAAATRAEAAEQRAKTEAARAQSAEQRAEADGSRAVTAESRFAEERDRAEAERGRAEDERSRAEAERSRAESSAVEAQTAAARAETAEDRLAEVRRTLDPDGLWLFERRRLTRLWRDWVSVRLDEESPVPIEVGRDAVRIGIEIMASASREECGVPIDVVWDDEVDVALEPIATELALVVLRAADELVATARRTNGGELRVAAAGPDLVLTLATEPDQLVPPDLVLPSSAVGWRVESGPARLAVRLVGVLPGPSGSEPASEPTSP